MKTDSTEDIRRAMVDAINSDPVVPEGLTTDELRRDYEVTGFLAPFVFVRRKSDGVRGSFQFRHSPRVYFGFKED